MSDDVQEFRRLSDDATVSAVKWTGENFTAARPLVGPEIALIPKSGMPPILRAQMTCPCVEPGTWIVRDAVGDVRFVPDMDFGAEFEAI